MTRPDRPGWDFDYAPLPWPRATLGSCDVVVATFGPVDAHFHQAISGILPGAAVVPLVERAPLFWTRVRAAAVALPAAIAEALSASSVPLRYVASSTCPSGALGTRLDFEHAPAAEPAGWRARDAAASADDSEAVPRPWFLEGGGGLAVDRAVCGTGVGTRLAVVDDEADARERLPALDRVELVGLDQPPRALHGTMLVGWAIGASPEHGGPFRGVAPDASARLYCVPKAEVDVVSVPLAIARAVLDGADVILCATGLEAKTSPMLDDALAVAARLGRGGRGALVVMPSGRQASSSGAHVSWTVALGDPASDPRVVCVGPSGRDGTWFLYPDRRGRLRPFANRGPAVRWLAPGDDVPNPLYPSKLSHCESSGASAFAAGVALLVLALNPRLRAHELDTMLARSAVPVPAAFDPARGAPADSHDVRPEQADRDGHNAKHGYGRLDATSASAFASDPVAAAFVTIGERALARAYVLARQGPLAAAYSGRLARWVVRVMLADPSVDHAVRVLARHVRLALAHEEARLTHGDGALLRQVAILLRTLSERVAPPRPGRQVAKELHALEARATLATATDPARGVDAEIYAALSRALVGEPGQAAQRGSLTPACSFGPGTIPA